MSFEIHFKQILQAAIWWNCKHIFGMMFINQFDKAWKQCSQSINLRWWYQLRSSIFSKFTDSRSKNYNQMISFTGIFQRFANIFADCIRENHRKFMKNNKLILKTTAKI